MKQIFHNISSAVEIEPCVAVKFSKESPEATTEKHTTDCVELTFFCDNFSPVTVAVNKTTANEIAEKLRSVCAN